VIPNETDAAGWWTLTVIRYECPDFETGFNAQCKQYTPLSETKVVHVIHPDENVIEANWTCLENCDQGLFVKAYRHPVEPIKDNWLLYVEDRSLKSSPTSPVFDHEELRTIYDGLPDTPEGMQTYLAENRPLRSPDGRLLIINDPRGATWLANLESGALHTISRSPVPTSWCPASDRVVYFADDNLFVMDVETLQSQSIWQQSGLAEPELRCANEIVVKSEQATWYISTNGRYVRRTQPDPSRMATVEDYVTARNLLPVTAWALSHDERKVALGVNLGHPLRNAIILYDIATQTHTVAGPINGYRVPEIRWTAGDELLLIGATNPKFPSAGAIFTMLPEEDVLPEVLLESDMAYLVDILQR
jgi:hypothetical protein